MGQNQPLKVQGLRDLGHYSAYNWLLSTGFPATVGRRLAATIQASNDAKLTGKRVLTVGVHVSSAVGDLPPCVAESTVGRNQPLKAQRLRDLGHYSAYDWLFSAHGVFRYRGMKVMLPRPSVSRIIPLTPSGALSKNRMFGRRQHD